MSAIFASRPTLALAWKEWREQRPSVLAGISLAILLPFILLLVTSGSSRPLGAGAVADLLPGIYLLFVWPLFAAATGASTVSNEISDGTLTFLLSRPVSRRRIWIVKVLVALFAAILILAGSMTVAWIARLLSGDARGPGAPFSPDGLPSWLTWMLAISISMMLFAAAVLCSTIFARAMTAGAAALAATLLTLAGLYSLWTSLDLQPGLAEIWALLDVGLTALLTLLASLMLFSWGELLRGSRIRKLLMLSGVAVAGASSIVAIPVVQWYSRLTPANAKALDHVLSPAGDAIAMTVTNLDRPSPQIWMVPADGSGLQRLTASGTFNPGISNSGHLVAYLSEGGMFGWYPSHLDLRIMNADGSGDRRLATLPPGDTPTSWSGRVVFSPNDRQVAVMLGAKLTIAPVQGGKESVVDVATDGPAMNFYVVGWNKTSSAVLVAASARRDSPPESSLILVDVASGSSRVIFKSSDGPLLVLGRAPRPGWSLVPFVIQGVLTLVDTESGQAQVIATQSCYWSPVVSDDSASLVYAVCSGPKGSTQSEVRLRDLTTGSERVLATLPGMAGRICPSPSWDRMFVGRQRATPGDMLPVIVGLDGQQQEIATSSSCLGWHGREHVVVTQWERGDWIGLVDVASGETKTVFPQ